MPSAMASTHSVNNSREAVRATRLSSQGTTRVPTTSASSDEHRDLGERERQRKPGLLRASVRVDLAGIATQGVRERGQHHQCEDHCQVFDDEPADGDLAFRRLQRIAFLERAQQHHGAGDRQ